MNDDEFHIQDLTSASKNPSSPYECYKVEVVRCLYVVFILVWIVTIYALLIYKLPYSYILVIPVIFFIAAMINARDLSEEVESEMSRIIFFPLMIVVSVNIVAWIGKDYIGNLKLTIRCIIVAIVFLLISSYDFWVHRDYLFAYRHAQSAFETMAITLIIYVVIIYGASFSK